MLTTHIFLAGEFRQVAAYAILTRKMMMELLRSASQRMRNGRGEFIGHEWPAIDGSALVCSKADEGHFWHCKGLRNNS